MAGYEIQQAQGMLKSAEAGAAQLLDVWSRNSLRSPKQVKQVILENDFFE
jgi:hypothetical protein